MENYEYTVMSQEKQNPKYVAEENKVIAGVLALLLGGIGAHKFYLGRIKQGIGFLLLSWTGIPVIIAFIEGVMILANNKQLL